MADRGVRAGVGEQVGHLVGESAVEEAGESRAGDELDVIGPTSRWRPLVALVLSLFGLADATYLTLTHYTTAVQLYCNSSGLVDCQKVTTSPESYVFGIPVAVLGLAFFVAMVPLNLPAAWRSTSALVARARLAMVVVGVGFVLYLISAELFEIGSICLYCTGVHVITFLLFVLVVTGWQDTGWGAVGQWG